jgi:hypothetical protein
MDSKGGKTGKGLQGSGLNLKALALTNQAEERFKDHFEDLRKRKLTHKSIDAFDKNMHKQLKNCEKLPAQYAGVASRPIHVYRALGVHLPLLDLRIRELEQWKENLFRNNASSSKKPQAKRSKLGDGASSLF